MSRPESLTLQTLAAALTDKPTKPSELAEGLGVARATLHRKLLQLQKEGLVVKVGKGPTSAYRRPTLQEAIAQEEKYRPKNLLRLVLPVGCARVLREALEFVSRIGIGQYRELDSMARFGALGTGLMDYDKLQSFEQLVIELSALLRGTTSHGGPSISNHMVAQKSQKCWAYQQALRHRMAWDQSPTGGMGVWFDEPLDSGWVQGLFVYSFKEGQEAVASRYVLEFLEEDLGILVKALEVAKAIKEYRFEALIDLAKEGWSVREPGYVFGPGQEDRARMVCAEMHKLLSENKSASSEDWAYAAAILSVLQSETPATEGVASITSGIAFGPAAGSQLLLNLGELPAGTMLQSQNGEYRVIVENVSEKTLVIVGSSKSLQTAILMAWNYAKSGKTRSWSM